MPHEKNRPGFIIGVFIGAFLFGMFAFFVANAFNGPTQSAGVGSGAIGVGASTNDISIGTSSPSATVKALIVGSTTDSSAYALQVLESNGSPILYIRNDGAIGIATTSVTAGTLNLQGNITLSGSVTCGGTCGGTVSAGNVTAGDFGSLGSGGNYAFPSNLGVATASQVGLPQALSVYGAGYFSGNLYAANVSSSAGTGNAFFGSLPNMGVNGINDTVLGVSAGGGGSSAGSNDVLLGYGAGYNVNASSVLYIANSSSGAPLVYGNFSNGQLAVNTTTLNVNPGLTIAGGLSVSGLGSGGSPCLNVGATGILATTTCGGGSLSGGQNNFIPLWTSGSSLGTSTLQATANALVTTGGFAIGTTTNQSAGNLFVTGNVTTTNITVSNLGSSGSPCLNVNSTGVLATTTCGGGSLSGGQNNFIPLWTGASSLATSTLQENGTTTYTTNGFAIGTSTVQSAGNLFITGNYLGGTLSANLVSSNAFGSGNFAFPSNLNIGTSSTAGATTLSVQGTALVTGATTLQGAATLQATTTLLGVTEASGTQYYSLFASSTANASQTTINWNNSNVQELKLTTSTTITFTNTNAGARYILMLLQDGTGSRTVTWPSTVQWAASTAPTLTTTPSKLDIITFVCAGVSSTDCYGGANLNYSP